QAKAGIRALTVTGVQTCALPIYRFAGVPDRFMRKHLYLDFTGYKRSKGVMHAPVDEILPGFKTVRDQGLNMIEATQLHQLGSSKIGRASCRERVAISEHGELFKS